MKKLFLIVTIIANHSCKNLSNYESVDIRVYDESILSIYMSK